MKRLFFILLFFVLCLSGCQEKYGILDYQEKDIVAECIINKEYRVEIKKEGQTRFLSVIEPDEAQGISFEIGERVFAITGDTKIEVEREGLKGICALSEIFSQSEDCMTSASQSAGESVLTFQKDDCFYKITIGKNSLPKRVCISAVSFEYDVDIVSIELKESK